MGCFVFKITYSCIFACFLMYCSHSTSRNQANHFIFHFSPIFFLSVIYLLLFDSPLSPSNKLTNKLFLFSFLSLPLFSPNQWLRPACRRRRRRRRRPAGRGRLPRGGLARRGRRATNLGAGAGKKTQATRAAILIIVGGPPCSSKCRGLLSWSWSKLGWWSMSVWTSGFFFAKIRPIACSWTRSCECHVFFNKKSSLSRLQLEWIEFLFDFLFAFNIVLYMNSITFDFFSSTR